MYYKNLELFFSEKQNKNKNEQNLNITRPMDKWNKKEFFALAA